MGYYINNTSNGDRLPDSAKGKIDALVADGATIVDVNEFQPNLVCVVDNGPWAAAGYAYDQREFDLFRRPDREEPQRPRVWLVYEHAAKLSGYLKNK